MIATPFRKKIKIFLDPIRSSKNCATQYIFKKRVALTGSGALNKKAGSFNVFLHLTRPRHGAQSLL